MNASRYSIVDERFAPDPTPPMTMVEFHAYVLENGWEYPTLTRVQGGWMIEGESALILREIVFPYSEAINYLQDAVAALRDPDPEDALRAIEEARKRIELGLSEAGR